MNDLSRFVERRRSDLERLGAFTIQPTRVAGFDTIHKAGEILYPVTFPVWFVERPSMTFGGELSDTQPLVSGSFPTVHVVVHRWTMALADRPGGGYFVGAELAVVVTGPDEVSVIVHWGAEGKAMRNPHQPNESLETRL